MKNILVIGSTGQIGSELTMKLRTTYPNGQVVAGYIPAAPPKGELAETGPCEIVDITDAKRIAELVDKYKIDTIYNLAALLSYVAEQKPQLAWHIGIGGLLMYLKSQEKRIVLCSPLALLVHLGTTHPKTKRLKTPSSVLKQCMV